MTLFHRRLAPGTLIDSRYEIIGLLGEGGFATVYRARQVHIDREVAIKLLHLPPGFDKQREFEQRFIREAQLVAKIHHEGIVAIHDFGFFGQEKQPYIAMEVLEGHDLSDELKAGPLQTARAVRLIIQALDALGCAHEKDIVHKDLKPANLFVVRPGTAEERLKVVDFGVARVGHDAKLSSTGQIFGTPQYLAPEYIARHEANPPLDVYQMGLILAELLLGRPVISEENPLQCVVLHAGGKLDLPASLIKGPLGPILLRALALDPSQRFPNAHAFRDALAAVPLESVAPSPLGSGAQAKVPSSGPRARPPGIPETTAMETPSRPVIDHNAPTQGFNVRASGVSPATLYELGASPSGSPSHSSTNELALAASSSAAPRLALGAIVLLVLALGAFAAFKLFNTPDDPPAEAPLAAPLPAKTPASEHPVGTPEPKDGPAATSSAPSEEPRSTASAAPAASAEPAASATPAASAAPAPARSAPTKVARRAPPSTSSPPASAPPPGEDRAVPRQSIGDRL